MTLQTSCIVARVVRACTKWFDLKCWFAVRFKDYKYRLTSPHVAQFMNNNIKLSKKYCTIKSSNRERSQNPQPKDSVMLCGTETMSLTCHINCNYLISRAIIKLPFYQISIVVIFYGFALFNCFFSSQRRVARQWIVWDFFSVAFTCEIPHFIFILRNCVFFSTQKFPPKISTWAREKFRHSRDHRQNIYLSELTNEYWSTKHERKIHWYFLFSLLRRRCPNASLRLYWFASTHDVYFLCGFFLATELFASDTQCRILMWRLRGDGEGGAKLRRKVLLKVSSLDLDWEAFRAKRL